MDHDAHNMAASQPTGLKNNGAHELDWVPLERDATTTSDRAPIGFHQSAVRTPRTASTTNGSTHFPNKKRHPTRHQRLRFRKRLLKLNTSPPVMLFEKMNLSNESSSQEDDHLDFHQMFDRIQCNILTHLKDLSL